jgi:CheY-like chemotaxis protein
VDDEIAIVEILTGILEDEGYRVTHAANGRDALASIAAQQPDLVLLDVMMPILDGWETLQAIRASGRDASLPVLMMSAAPRPEDFVEDERTRFLRKPFDVDDLLRAIAAMITGPPPTPEPAR